MEGNDLTMRPEQFQLLLRYQGQNVVVADLFPRHVWHEALHLTQSELMLTLQAERDELENILAPNRDRGSVFCLDPHPARLGHTDRNNTTQSGLSRLTRRTHSRLDVSLTAASDLS